MYSEYGYIEEGRLGKPYDLRLLRRLGRYALPYRKLIFTALFLTVLITLFELALPYLSKIAIDRYILASWYRVDLSRMGGEERDAFTARHGPFPERSRDGGEGFIDNAQMKRMDPARLHEFRKKGLISERPFYRISPHVRPRELRAELKRDGIVARTGALFVPLETLNGLEPGEILRLRSGDVRGVAMISALLLVLLALSFGLGYGEYYLLEMTGQNIMQDIRLELFQRMEGQALRFFDRHPVGRLVTRVTNDIENLNEMFKSVMITVFKDVFILTGIVAVLLYLNWKLALVCFALIPFIFGLTLLFSSLARDAFRELREKVSKMNAFLQEKISGMRIIQLFAREAFQMEKFSRINHENYLAGMRQIRIFGVFMPLMELFSSFAVALLIWYGGGRVINEQLTLGGLVAFISYIQMFFKPIRDIAEKYNIMQSAMASTERIVEFMDYREEIPDPAEPIVPDRIRGRLEFRDVSFAYEQDRPVLEDVSFEVDPGEMVAVVGATGAGKTTVVSLVERFYDPLGGRVLLDGVDIREMSKRELRAHIGLVMQDVFVFAGTIRDNITMGDEGIPAERVERAIQEANADRFIQRLPRGLDEEIGEGGATLSAGERQLLSFARALAYDPEILILDEATSSVDPETERLIQDAILRITKRRTTLVVAHRLSTIRHADRILVMHRGRIREQGTHEELTALGGLYAKLSRFREA
ncbi:MAG: ABC transporter ATP-binding protein [Deltaproteobacteria bacterium]|nr:ABC transporter ATP-binding protein [Deltaproteobacteria bacterium]